MILVEHLVRTNILLIACWIFEASHEKGYPSFDPKYTTIWEFLSDHSHQ
ncbi:MAG: hypothetical protein GY801_26105 [bacterium]|nr:hypothetical protein [bacterium]